MYIYEHIYIIITLTVKSLQISKTVRTLNYLTLHYHLIYLCHIRICVMAISPGVFLTLCNKFKLLTLQYNFMYFCHIRICVKAISPGVFQRYIIRLNFIDIFSHLEFKSIRSQQWDKRLAKAAFFCILSLHLIRFY